MLMKKNTVLPVCIVIAIFLLSACDSGAGVNSELQNQGPSRNDVSLFGGPDRNPDVFGKVKSILGNELVVYKLDSNREELADAEKEKLRNEMQNLSPEEKAKRREERNKTAGETLELIIPVGTPIISLSNLSGKTEVTELQISDIKEGQTLRIWLEEAAPGTTPSSEFIHVQQFGQQ
ncbi:MAG: hypothetical protein HPY66_0717 [Firmicutes bacterium]|nr:hypothetical protein [Bacillota bacterium]